MNTAEERLAFAVRFGETNLNTLRPGDWLNLRDDVDDFLRPEGSLAATGGILAQWTGPDPRELTEKDIWDLQSTVQAILNGLVSGREMVQDTPPATDLGPQLQFPTLSYALVPAPPPFVGRTILYVSGSTQDVFLAILLHLLWREPTNKIRRCPECGGLFVRNRKQRYCSQRCTKRATMRTWRKKPQGKAAAARSSRAQYERKVKQKTGSKNPKTGTYQKRKIKPKEV